MEPLVAESVVLSASGEPVRPERKAQSPTSPRPHPSDDEGKNKLLFSSIGFSFFAPIVIGKRVSVSLFLHFIFIGTFCL